MKPMLLFYGYYRLRDGKPVDKFLYETLDELRNALFSRYKHTKDIDDLYNRVIPFRCYVVDRRGKKTKIYDQVSKRALMSYGV